MKIITKYKLTVFIAAMIFNVAASAYSDDKPEEFCKKPKFTDLSFKIYSEPEKFEIPAGSELKFRISKDADPNSLVVSAKNVEIPVKVETNTSFHQVSFTLPDNFTGSIVRINARVKAVLKCDETAGWLIKVADK
jgi:hypothetical protein